MTNRPGSGVVTSGDQFLADRFVLWRNGTY